ncbi:helix-loop-helix DNA-binding domain-containing protein [Apiospora arundinis]|uniref:Helix-loop-helix DNA-binding domain-containing protein n=1 Tax=Apiospora arundinis TaxID=335852 RepID=A0ABR2JB43_9PEZI
MSIRDMVMMDPNNWNGQDHTMTPTGEDDFQQFLELGGMSNMGDGLQFDFQDFGAATNPPSMMHPHQGHHDHMDTAMSGTETAGIIASSSMPMPTQMIPTTSETIIPTVPSQMLGSQHPNSGDALSNIDAQIHFLQHQRMQEQHRQLQEQSIHFEEQQINFFAQQQRNMIPPTPQSLEMHASNHYYTQQQRSQQQQQQHRPGDQTPQHSHGMFDRYPRLKDQTDMAFTPLVSPAVTPLDTQFSVETQFTVPGAYFSPLTSPALHAQNPESIPNFDPTHLGSTATNSPVEMDLESTTPPPSAVDLSKKVRQKNVNKARKSGVRQSPIVKPHRKKTASTPIMNAQVLSELAETLTERTTVKPAPTPTASAEDSENASVSPEALSEMPPPPVPQPRSARQSPYIQAQNSNNAAASAVPAALNGGASPATPASLFRISPRNKSADSSNPGQIASEHIENFELPESANFPKPQLPQINTQPDSGSPDPESGRSSTLQPLPSPIFARPSQPSSATASPQLTPKLSATNSRKTPLLAARGSRKRSSVSSVQVSPALLPRISPNIKPLLPGTPGLSAEDTASRLLTSKSNYQNILEGNTVPGVSYPSELSTNLTSKRTSHKIAEQGRRNRINSALQEIATLLPKSVIAAKCEEEGESPGSDKMDKKDSKSAANAPNSKASTVEMAIVYIKQLQQEVADANKRAEEAEQKLAAAA